MAQQPIFFESNSSISNHCCVLLLVLLTTPAIRRRRKLDWSDRTLVSISFATVSNKTASIFCMDAKWISI